MQINKVQSNNYGNQPNFGMLKITERGAKALCKAFNPEQLEQIGKLGKELENTKHFDLEVSSIMDDLFYKFVHKTNNNLDSEAPLHPVSINGKTLKAFGVDLLDCGDTFTYNNLEFPSAQEAGKAYAELSTFEKNCTPILNNRNLFERLEWAVKSTKILDRVSEHIGSDNIRIGYHPTMPTIREPKPAQIAAETTKPAKPSLTQRLKNAWEALKGN